jgi:hypothetical protein
MKTGADETTSKLRIRVILPPTKWKYSDFEPGGRRFNVDGLLVALQEDTDPSYPHQEYLSPYTLTYEIASVQVLANTSYAQNDGDPLSDLLSGMVEVTVYYHEPGGIPYKDTFLIICDSGGSDTYTNIPDGNYRLVSTFGQFQSQVINGAGTQGTYVIIFTNSFDFTSEWPINDAPVGNVNRKFLFIFVAANPAGSTNPNNPNVRLGRNLDATNINEPAAFQPKFTYTGFYFGKWPFNTELWVSGTNYARIETIAPAPPAPYPNFRYSSWEYVINATGPRAQIDLGQPDGVTQVNNKTNPFIKYSLTGPGRLYRVTLEEGLIVVPFSHRETKFY